MPHLDDFQRWMTRATGHAPYPYQAKLALGATLPDQLTVPTGSGKTAAIVLAWLFRRLAPSAADSLRAATPRRLVYCLPTRALVDQTARVARGWLEALGHAGDVDVAVLRSGALDSAWDGKPEGDAILIGTQDQLLSRALCRGFATSPARWPIPFAWLHADCWWVLDETQLFGPGLSTATQLQGLREKLGTVAPVFTTFMSATNDPRRLQTIDYRGRERQVLELSSEDRSTPTLARRLAASKGLSACAVPFKDVKGLAAHLLAAHQRGTRTLCVVNTVARAVAVYEALGRATRRKQGAPRVAVLHSRFRPADRAAIADPTDAAGALSPDFQGILVATQVVEAGVDISSRRLVTDLCSWAAFVQRVGRCNRAGEHSEATVEWIDVPDKASLPYTPEELADCRLRLAHLDDVGPATLTALPEPTTRPALPVLRRRDLLELFDTTPDLGGAHTDVSRFIRDSEERDVFVAWRDLDGKPPALDMPRPAASEVCRVPAGSLRSLLSKQGPAWRWDRLAGAWLKDKRPHPQSLVVLDRQQGGYREDLGWTGKPAHKPTAPPAPTDLSPLDADDADPWTTCVGRFVDLATHLDDVVEAVDRLAPVLEGWEVPWERLSTAARWHDLGKVHPAFQEMLVSHLPEDAPEHDDGPWAKSDGLPGGTRCSRRHIRHELASALAWLAHDGDDLTAFLIAAHHGKVRLRIQARPTEPVPPSGAMVALGVHHGDSLPAASLGGGVEVPETTLSLDVAVLGGAGVTRSWADRTAGLVAEHGPFRLAAWESLLRIADWRGSAVRMSADTTLDLERTHD